MTFSGHKNCSLVLRCHSTAFTYLVRKKFEKAHQKIPCYNVLLTAPLAIIYLFPLTRELRALHGAWATPRSSSILEKTERSSARSICTGLVPRIFTPLRCNGAARLLGIWPPTDTMLPEQPWRGEERKEKE